MVVDFGEMIDDLVCDMIEVLIGMCVWLYGCCGVCNWVMCVVMEVKCELGVG